MNDFAYASATKLTKAIQAKRISSVELLELYIERYERLNPLINAIVATDFDNARIRARAADEKLSKGESWGPLHGKRKGDVLKLFNYFIKQLIVIVSSYGLSSLNPIGNGRRTHFKTSRQISYLQP